MITFNALISHRFRGFSPQENTLDGLSAALSFGVQHLEFDIRVAKCGTPMIYHDEHAPDTQGHQHMLCDVMARDFRRKGGRFTYMPTAEVLFSTIAAHPNRTAKFWVDIKDAGFETEIHALVCQNRLQDRVIYVSWVPESLYALHRLTPQTPLCLSHWCKSPNTATRTVHKVYTAQKGHVTDSGRAYIHGERSGWYVDGPVQGTMRDILKASKGSVCVPQNMVSAEFVTDYHKSGIDVSTFSYTDMDVLKTHKREFNIDLYMVDNKSIFENL